MKRILFRLIMALTTLTTIATANADALRLDQYVILRSDDGSADLVTAFRSNIDCLSWQYLPDYLSSTGQFKNRARISNTQIKDQKYLTYVSAMDLTLSSQLTSKNLADLKSAILEKLKHDHECASQITSSSTVDLTPALVQSAPVESADSNIQSSFGSFFGTLKATPGNSHADVYRDVSNPMTATFTIDASDPNAAQNLKSIVDGSQNAPERLGEIGFFVKGVAMTVNSHIIMDGDISAIFNSSVKQTHCDTKDNSKHLSQSFGPGPGPTQDFGYSDKGMTCSYDLLTEYKGGAYKNIISFDDKGSIFMIGDKPIMFTWYNEKNEPQRTTLMDFVHTTLFKLLLMSNYDVALDKIVNNTYNITLGRKGNVQTTMHLDVGDMMSFGGQTYLGVGVYAAKLDAHSLDLSWTNSARTTCLTQNYATQLSLFTDYVNTSFMPVANQCLTGGM